MKFFSVELMFALNYATRANPVLKLKLFLQHTFVRAHILAIS